MAFLTLFIRRQLPRTVSLLGGLAEPLGRPARAVVPVLRRLHGAARLRVGEKPGPWGKSRPPEQQYQLTELDKADALMLRKSHETGVSSRETTNTQGGVPQGPWLGTIGLMAGFLSWFRNGLLATGIGVIAFVQSEGGREAGYAFFILGGVCVSFGGTSYISSLFALRRLMLLSVPTVLLHGSVVCSIALFWLCAVSLYIGRLEVEIIHEDEEGEDEGECRECRDRREQRGYRGSQGGEEGGSKG